MDTIDSSKNKLVTIYQTTQRKIPEVCNFYIFCFYYPLYVSVPLFAYFSLEFSNVYFISICCFVIVIMWADQVNFLENIALKLKGKW
jgi:hypothetical protein